ncbi:conserved Plasmodium protein, unknown function [Plasmodium chabaudi chabaudi]|uniref:Uncharacterized protein n=1 Tax=Plasmodium chabaudi chabaudi TaxID=31271 RepID=A0A1C6XNP5_PLACU|nr:conserved Plasmodium protein, unknown function [Plasmodium chabaudi chabaudi]
MYLCFTNFSCKKIPRKKLYKYCDEQTYISNLTYLYIYYNLGPKIGNTKKNTYNENINKYVGKISNHLKINKHNSNLVYSLQNIWDIFIFNYFQFSYNYKLVFLYNIFYTINKNENQPTSLNDKRYQKKKHENLNNISKILLTYDILYVFQIRNLYVKKFIDINKDNKKNYLHLLENETNQKYSLVPFHKKTFIEHLVESAKNIKDLSILISIIRNIFSIYHKFDYTKLLDNILKKFYLFFKNISIIGSTDQTKYLNNITHIDKHTQIEHTKNIKLRDIIYSFYQFINFKNEKKYQFIFLKAISIVNQNYKYIYDNPVDNNLSQTNKSLPTQEINNQTDITNLFLSNKDIEQLFFLMSNNSYVKYYFAPLLVTQFYLKFFFSKNLQSVLYTHKLFTKNYKNINITFPIYFFQFNTLSYIKFLNQISLKNNFHTFYQAICIKYLLKKKNHENLNSLNKTCGTVNYPYINYIIFYKNAINKIINQSFNDYISKLEQKEKLNYNNLKTIMNNSYFKYSENFIYNFSQNKFFYLIYLKQIIKKNMYNKKYT